jgi:hypothetical protein
VVRKSFSPIPRRARSERTIKAISAWADEVRDGANVTALLQHPNHLPASALDVEEAFERVIVGKIGRLTNRKRNDSRLVLRTNARTLSHSDSVKAPVRTTTSLRRISPGGRATSVLPEITGGTGLRGRSAYSCCKLIMCAMIASNSGRMHARCSHERLSFTQRASDHDPIKLNRIMVWILG